MDNVDLDCQVERRGSVRFPPSLVADDAFLGHIIFS